MNFYCNLLRLPKLKPPDTTFPATSTSTATTPTAVTPFSSNASFLSTYNFKLHQASNVGANSKSVTNFGSSHIKYTHQDLTHLTNNNSSCLLHSCSFFLPAFSATGTRQPFHFLPHPHGSPRPSLAHICSATMLPRVGECYHVRHTLTVWRGTASTS